MDEELAGYLQSVIQAIEDAITAHQAGRDAPYSESFLRFVHDELTAMRDRWPSHPFRFGPAIVDWPETELGTEILRLGDAYRRQRKSAFKAPLRLIRSA
jgi:hypothetical protein